MREELKYTCLSNTGKRRDNNEDNFWCDGHCLPAENDGTAEPLEGTVLWENDPVFGLFDGMGGESSGEVAASLAAESLGKFTAENAGLRRRNPRKFLMALSSRMNREVCDYQREHRLQAMGSTANMMVFHKGSVHLSNLGDSRIYWISQNKITQISKDHVYPGITFGKAPLIQYLGLDEEEMELEPSYTMMKCRIGDRILMCSDGLTDLVSDQEIEETVNSLESIREAAEVLLNIALARGGKDNITILIVEVVSKPKTGWMQRIQQLLGGSGI